MQLNQRRLGAWFGKYARVRGWPVAAGSAGMDRVV